MNIPTELYANSLIHLPKSGQQVIGHQTGDQIIVYQAYNKSIAAYAVANQAFGGPDYSYNRMSWIKPNFLWMMYRCGWAEKDNQERVLALWIDKTDFEAILGEAVISSFNSKYYDSHEQWKQALENSEVRMQWDPDHDPFGSKLERRAIQLGLKGKMLENFGKYQVKKIDDITGFVKEQKQLLDNGRLKDLLVPVETVVEISAGSLKQKIGISLT